MGTSVVLLSVAGLAIGLRLYFGTTVLTLSLGPVSATLILALLWLLVSLGKQQAAVRAKDTAPICAAELADAGFGPLPGDAPSGASLYVDMLKRSLLNLIYYESSQALWIYGPDHQFKMTEGFDLAARAVGEDMPGNAMTMVGLKRLENIQACVETVLAEGVPGDLVECGACKGGACIFMRGLLKAGGDTKRKVFVADTFSPPDPPPPFAVSTNTLRQPTDLPLLLSESPSFFFLCVLSLVGACFFLLSPYLFLHVTIVPPPLKPPEALSHGVPDLSDQKHFSTPKQKLAETVPTLLTPNCKTLS